MTGAESDTSPRWSSALEALWAMNRVHCGPEMSAAYRKLSEFYDNLEIIGFASGSKSGSWVAPPEWIVENATLMDPNGRKIADWSENLLSLYSFSPSYTGLVELETLEEHLFSIPNKPKRTPFHFRNQYRHWKPEWGFCIPQETRDSLINGKYEVNIITRFEPGVMEMAEQVHYGMLDDSFLLVGHFDHPQMCNDGLVGCLAGCLFGWFVGFLVGCSVAWLFVCFAVCQNMLKVSGGAPLSACLSCLSYLSLSCLVWSCLALSLCILYWPCPCPCPCLVLDLYCLVLSVEWLREMLGRSLQADIVATARSSVRARKGLAGGARSTWAQGLPGQQ